MMQVETHAKIIVETPVKDLLTWLIFVLDRSGSMESIKKDMIGGFNQFLKDQKKIKGICKATLYQFDTQFENVFDDVDVNSATELTDKNYLPRGGTALLDAVAMAINKTNQKIATLDEDKRPDKVLIITITDGEENSSHEYSGKVVKEMVEHQSTKWKWEFAYIGANQDAWTVGSSMGLAAGRTMNYVASAGGVKGMFDTLADSTTRYRSTANADFTFDKDTAEEAKDVVV